MLNISYSCVSLKQISLFSINMYRKITKEIGGSILEYVKTFTYKEIYIVLIAHWFHKKMNWKRSVEGYKSISKISVSDQNDKNNTH